MTDPPGRRTREAVAMALGAFAVYALLASSSSLWDRDEPRFARAAVEMRRTGDLLVPTYEGAPRLHKPPLVTWMMAASMGVLGETALAARLPSAAAAALTVFLVFVAGRTLFSARAGLSAAALFAVSPLVLLEAAAATADAVLLLFVTASLVLAAKALMNGFRPSHAIGLALLLALAQLAKGPVGLAVPLLVVGLAALLSRAARLPAGALAVSAAASLALFLLWAVPANAATSGRLLAEGFGRHVVGRSLAPMEGHGGRSLAGVGYYLPVVTLGFLPGLLYLPAALSALFGKRLGERAGPFLLAWVLAPLALFTLVATKLPHYVLPCWPALALLCGGALDAAVEGRLGERDRVRLGWGAIAYAAVALAAVVLYLVLPSRADLPALRLPCAVLALLAGVSSAIGLLAHVRGRYERATAVLTAGAAAMAVAAALLVLPVVERWKPVPPLAAAIRARVTRETPLATLGFEEPSLTFASSARSVRHLATPEQAEAWSREGGEGVLVLPRVELARMKAGGSFPPLEEIASASGWNVADGRRVDLVALLRR